MSDSPVCRHHGPMVIIEEGVLAGALTRYWGCLGTPRKTIDGCPRHGTSAYAQRRRDDAQLLAAATGGAAVNACLCRPAQECKRTARTEDTGHQQPDLFHDQEATA